MGRRKKTRKSKVAKRTRRSRKNKKEFKKDVRIQNTDSDQDWTDGEEERAIYENSDMPEIRRLKLTEGKHKIKLLGTYKFYKFHWLENVKRTVKCPGEECPLCLKGSRPKLRYAINVYNYKDKEVQIMEFGRKLKVDIMNIVAVWGSTKDFDVIITRIGTKKEDTVYTPIAVLPKTELPRGLELFDLEKIYQPTDLEKINEYLAGKVEKKGKRRGKEEVSEENSDDDGEQEVKTVKDQDDEDDDKDIDLEALLGDQDLD